MIEKLGSGPASVSELGSPFPMSLSAIGQHIQLLEEAGLVRTEKTGRTRTVQLAPAGLTNAERWLESHKSRWERRFDRLGALLDDEDCSPLTKRKKGKHHE